MGDGKQQITPYYSRRSPEQTVMYQVVFKEMNTMFSEMEESGRYLPHYVRKEFEAYLDCGILSKGFLRLHCVDGKNETLVAF